MDYTNLICPFPSEVNVHASAANQHMLQWAAALRMIPKQYTLGTTIQRMDYGWLGGRVHPNAKLEALQIATEWQCWLFFCDDLNDESEQGKQPEQMKLSHRRYLEIIDGGMPVRGDSPPTIALAELLGRMRKVCGAECLRRFRGRVADHFAAILWEAENRVAGLVPDPTTYCRLRRDTSAVYTCFELIDITEEISLPPEVRDHPQVEMLGCMANNVTSWCNDIISLKKEMRAGDVHNLVIVLQRYHDVSLDEAIGMAIDQHNAEVRAYLQLESQLPSFGPEIDAQMQRYLRGLRSWMRGNMDWGLAAKRYTTSRRDSPSQP